MMLFMNLMAKNCAMKGMFFYFFCQTVCKTVATDVTSHTSQTLACAVFRVTIEHARLRSRGGGRGGLGRGRYSDRFSSRRPRNERR